MTEIGNVLSLFDGMSNGQIALNRSNIGYKNYYASEIDEHAIGVTMANYPDTIQLGDVTRVKGSDLPEIDLLIGGSPCQGFSLAGNRLNFNDPRSKLFFEYVRLKNELNPRYFMLENVVVDRAWVDIISEQVGVSPYLLNSSDVSGQERARLYWTNIPLLPLPVDRKIKFEDILESGRVLKPKSQTILATLYKENAKSMLTRRKKGLLVYEGTGDINEAFNLAHDKPETYKHLWRKVSPLECERLQTVPDNYTASASDTQRYRMLGNGWTIDIISHIFNNLK